VNGLPIARIAGFEVRLHLSWVLILAFITITVGKQLEALEPTWPAAVPYLLGGVSAFAFLASVLAHELAHGVVARRQGVASGPITLFFFGGTASAELEASRPRAETAIAVAGSAASIAIGIASSGLALAVFAIGGGLARLIADGLLILGVLNFVLGFINLVPAFPLDGGRILRALVWWGTGSERTGTRVAVLAGRVVGWAMALAGLGLALIGDWLNGIMLVIAGWFVGNGARAMQSRLQIEELISDVQVGEAMECDLPAIAPQLTLDTFVDRFQPAGEATTLPVMSESSFLGLVGLSQVRRVARRRFPTTRASDVMVARLQLPALGPTDGLWPAIERLRRSGLDGLPVIVGDDLLGVLTRRAAMEAIQGRARLRREGLA